MIAIFLALAAPLPFGHRTEFSPGLWEMSRRAECGKTVVIRMQFDRDHGGWVDAGAGRRGFTWRLDRNLSGTWVDVTEDAAPGGGEIRRWGFWAGGLTPGGGKTSGESLSLRRVR